MVAEIVEQPPVFADTLFQPRPVFGAELLDSLLRRTASDHGLQSYAGVQSVARHDQPLHSRGCVRQGAVVAGASAAVVETCRRREQSPAA